MLTSYLIVCQREKIMHKAFRHTYFVYRCRYVNGVSEQYILSYAYCMCLKYKLSSEFFNAVYH